MFRRGTAAVCHISLPDNKDIFSSLLSWLSNSSGSILPVYESSVRRLEVFMVGSCTSSTAAGRLSLNAFEQFCLSTLPALPSVPDSEKPCLFWRDDARLLSRLQPDSRITGLPIIAKFSAASGCPFVTNRQSCRRRVRSLLEKSEQPTGNEEILFSSSTRLRAVRLSFTKQYGRDGAEKRWAAAPSCLLFLLVSVFILSFFPGRYSSLKQKSPLSPGRIHLTI